MSTQIGSESFVESLQSDMELCTTLLHRTLVVY